MKVNLLVEHQGRLSIPIGKGTDDERSTTVKILQDDIGFDYANDKHRPKHTRIRITQTIKLTFDATIVGRFCEICGKHTPMPDDDAGAFIIENNDNDRLHFAAEDDVKPERDCWPVKGWRMVTITAEVRAFACAECADTVEAKIKALCASLGMKTP